MECNLLMLTFLNRFIGLGLMGISMTVKRIFDLLHNMPIASNST